MKILIVGAGIGGLAAAGFFEKKGFNVTLIEQAPAIKHIGFSMTLFPNGRKLLRELGIDDEVAKKGYELPWLELANVKGHILSPKVSFVDLPSFGEPAISIERANLHSALINNLKNSTMLLGTTIKNMQSEKDRVHVEMSDNTKHTFDLVVAADGIGSKIREEYFAKHEALFYGWSLRFFWAPSHIPIPKGTIFLSKDKSTLGLYPVLGRCCVGIYEYNPKRIDHPPLSLDEFLPYLKKHAWTQKHLEDVIEESKNGNQYYDHLRHVLLGPWYKKRIVLLGDARHGLPPFTGLSGSMAIEDAFVLADELAKVDNTYIHVALENYSKRRNGRVKEVESFNDFLSMFYFIKSPIERMLRDFILQFWPKNRVPKKLKKIILSRI